MSKQKGNKKKIIIIIVIIAVLALAAVFFASKRSKQEEPAKPMIVKVMRDNIQTTISETGVIEPSRTVDVKSNIGGEVVELSVDEGDMVQAGQLIARIDPSDAQSTARQSMADLESAKSRVKQAQVNLELTKQQLPAQILQAQNALNSSMLKLEQSEKALAVQVETTKASIKAAEQKVHTAKLKVDQAKVEADQQPAITKASIDKANASLQAAKSALNNVKANSTPQKLTSAQTAYDQALSASNQAQKDLDRQEELLGKGYVAQSVVDTAREKANTTKSTFLSATERLTTVKIEIQEDITAAELSVRQAELSLETAKLGDIDITVKKNALATAQAEHSAALDSLDVAKATALQDELKAKDISIAKANVATEQANLKNAQAQLKKTNISEGDVLQAQAAAIKAAAQAENSITQLNYTTIISPTSGIVLTKGVEQGTIVSGSKNASAASTTVVTIADISKIYVTVNIDETDIANIKMGQKVNVTVDAYPDEEFTGQVVKISPTTTTEQNITTVPVKVLITQADAKLKPGMNATCDFILEERANVLCVISRAIQRDDTGKQYVLVKKGDDEVKTPVQTGLVGASKTEILGGVEQGTEIVIPVREGVTGMGSGMMQQGGGQSGGGGNRSGGNRSGSGGATRMMMR